jgi:hypothetical protein
MTTIRIAGSILTSYLSAGVDALADAGVREATESDAVDFAVIEAGSIGAYPDHTIHPDVGIVARDRGVIALQSPVRADELNAPTIWLRSTSRTTELVARTTAGPYFGFRPKAWVADDSGEADAVVVDEAAALLLLEMGFREDLTRAWFIITGMPLVTHALAIPQGADPEIVAAVADWFASAGAIDRDGRKAVRVRLADETGVPLDSLTDLQTGLRWTMSVDDRRAIAELFARAGVASVVGPVRWYRDENEPAG